MIATLKAMRLGKAAEFVEQRPDALLAKTVTGAHGPPPVPTATMHSDFLYQFEHLPGPPLCVTSLAASNCWCPRPAAGDLSPARGSCRVRVQRSRPLREPQRHIGFPVACRPHLYPARSPASIDRRPLASGDGVRHFPRVKARHTEDGAGAAASQVVAERCRISARLAAQRLPGMLPRVAPGAEIAAGLSAGCPGPACQSVLRRKTGATEET